MKRIFLFLTALCISTFLMAQTAVVFHEDFELPSLADSVISSSNPAGAAPWAISTHLKNSGLRSDSTAVQTSATTYLTTNSFSTIGYSKVSLKFAQICKLLIQDGGFIQFSVDGGNNWQLVTSAYYKGNGVMAVNKFNEYSYSTLWKGGDTLTKPTNNWWITETFDLSALVANQTDVKLRFCLTDGGTVGSEGRYGWLIDDITVYASNNEIDAPKITFKSPVLADTLYVTGPFTAQVYVKDSSALSSVKLFYSINGGTETQLTMTNTSDSTYIADLPSLTYNSSVCYRITASDIYNNSSSLPSGGCQSFITLKGDSAIQVGNTTTSGLNSPIYIASASSTYLYSYSASIYKKSEIMSGGVIQSIAFNKADAQGYNLGNATLRIYLKSVSSEFAPNTYTDYLNFRNGAVKVYESNTQNLNLSAGWQNFNFNTGSLFPYAGNENLMVFVEWYRPGNATGAVNWYYNTTSALASVFYGAAQTPTLSNTTGQRANIKINFQSSNKTYDATVLNFATPNATMTANSNVPVSIRVKNLGQATLTKAKVKWSLDGQYQGEVNWTGSLAQDFVGLPLNLGNINVAVGTHTLKAWTELPNDSLDQNPANDTTTFSIFACSDLTGVYTIGNSSSNFPTFSDALTALSSCGIIGPVTFKIKSGTYNQQLILPNINNTSATNTITFESETGNKNDVIIQYEALGTADNFTMKLDGCKNIILKNLTIKSLGTTYGRVIELANGANYNTIENCNIEMQASTSSTVSGIYNASSTFEHHNVIKNNEFNGGYYGVYFYGASATKEVANVFENNIFKNFYYYAMYLYYQDSIIVNRNLVTTPINTTAYGIYSYYNDNTLISNNKINMSAATTNYCLYLSNTNSTAGKSMVVNNFISQKTGTGTTYGIYATTAKNTDIIFNNINITAGSLTGGYGLYVTGGSLLNIKNNNLVNTGGGYAYYVSTVAAVDTSNFNNYFSTGTNLAYWSGAKTTLAALQTANNKDQNSLNINPQYVSVNDLHVTNFALFGQGYEITDITTDIDSNTRAIPPCIGADEFIVPLNDAGIALINAPSSMITTLNQDVKVTIKNMGISPLTSATISYSVNGIYTNSYSWTGSLLQNEADTVIIDNNIFDLGISNIKVWTSLPNGLADNFPLNDTLIKSIYACQGSFNGTYTIGGATADYQTLSDAAIALKNCGVSGPTIFNINPGTYTEQFVIDSIPGVNATNTVTFKSINNDSTSVKIIAPANTTNNYVVKFDNTDFVRFSSISFSNTSNTGRAIEITNGSTNIEISNSVIEVSQTTTSSTSSAIYSYNTIEKNLKIKNNLILGGYYGVYLYGVSTSSKEIGNVLEGNILRNFHYYGLYLYYMDSITVTNNFIRDRGSSTTVYSMYAYYNDNGTYAFNNIINASTSTTYGMYIYYANSTAGNSKVYNNFVSQLNGSGSVYAIYAYYGKNVEYYYNSVLVNAGSTTGGAFYATGGTSITAKNNSFTNLGGGYAYYAASTTSVSISDNNNIFSTGANLAYWGAAKANLAALQATSGKDLNSVSTNPNHFSSTNLHTENTLMYGKATPISGINTDIDGELRNSTKPCIGADEYVILPNDGKVRALYTLSRLPINAGSPHTVKTLIENRGANTLYNLNVSLAISGANTFNSNIIIDSITSGRVDTLNFASYTPSNYGVNNVKVSIPADDLLTNNELNYTQTVTDTIFGYADNSSPTTFLGFNTGQGLFVSKYYMNGSKIVPGVKVYITSSNTLGQNLYGVILNSAGQVIDSSLAKTITASDTNNWVEFNFLHPPLTTTANEYFYVGFAQLSGALGGYYPLGCQTENPTRKSTFYYTSNLNGGSLTEATQWGRFMIDAIIGFPPPFDASVAEIISPVTECNMVNKTVSIKIENLGSDTIVNGINNMVASYALKLNNNLINVVSENVSASILPSGIYTYTFNTPITLPAIGADSNYHIKAWVNLANDAYLFNDTTGKNFVSKYTPVNPTVISPISVNYATQANLTATSVDTVLWFANLSDTINIGGGSPFTTPYLFDSTTYYVLAGNINTAPVTQFVGPPNTSIGSGGGIGATSYVTLFDVLSPAGVTIKNVDLYPITSGAAYTMFIKNSSDVIIQSFTGTTTVANIKETVNVNFYVPAGTGYKLGFSSGPNFYRNTSGASHPYTIPGLVSITGNTFDPAYYYNAYNWEVFAGQTGSVGNGCTSNKVPLVVNVTNIPAIDAGISEILSPIGSIPSGTNTAVSVTIKNWGTSNLTSATINWSLDGVLKPSVNWTGNINNGASAPFTLTTMPFIGGLHSIKVWISNPNNLIDLYAINDTASNTFSACMNGLFTIGTGGNFTTFNQALQTINTAGLCGNVIFDVLPGTYDEQLIINQIPNAGPNSTVTFRSINGNSSTVELTYTGTSTTNAVLKLNGADYIRFENISIISTGASITRAVEITGGANYNKFTGNLIETDLATSSTYAPIYSTSSNVDNYNEFINNRISGGYYGIYWYGSSTNMKSNTNFIGNTINNFYYYGMYLYYNDSILVESNTVNNSGANTTSYGMYLYYNDNIKKVVKNKVHMKATTTNYGIYVAYCDNLISQPALVANNFISQEGGSGSSYLLYNTSSTNVNYYNNSINVTSGSNTSSYAIYIPSGTNVNVVNNNASNTAGGYAYYVSTPANINYSDYNNLYTSGTNVAYWSAARTTLDSLRKVSLKDSNSVSVNPNYTSNSNLHVVNFYLDGKAKSLASVTDDIDGDTRNINIPDIGADEFILPDYDAGVTALIEPFSPVNQGVQSFKAVIKNFGVINLNSVVINWTVNGVAKTPFYWTGNKALGETDTIVIGNHNFTAGSYAIKIWTSNPNNNADQINLNDTLITNLIACGGPLSGNYTIGGSTANYQTINQAISSLKYCGVSGPVTFNINPGNYNEQLVIGAVNGASDINRITFKSANNDSSSVIINYAPLSSANYVLRLDSADYISFKHLSIVNTTQNNVGRVVELINGANYNEFSNNVIQSVPSTSSACAGFYTASASLANYNMIRNNLILNGYYSAYFYGSSSLNKIGNSFIGNIVKGFYYYGIYNYYSDSITVVGNYIQNASNSGYVYGLYNSYINDLRVEKNHIDIKPGSYGYPIYVSYVDGTANKRALVANNFIAQSSGSNSYGLYVNYSNYVDVIHNSVFISQGATSRAIYLACGSGYSNIRIFNNSFVNTAGGTAVEVTATATTSNYITAMNYNNIWSSTLPIGKWGSTNCNTLASWITACAKDSNSISLNPDYLTQSNLHVYSIALNDKGTPIANVTDDFDGQQRNTTTPDIGADEFTPLPVDIGVLGVISPSNNFAPVNTTATVKCIVKNYGSTDASNFNISYAAGNLAPVTMNYTDTLFANTIDTVTFTTQLNVIAGPFVIKAYTTITNDGNLTNDTSKINYFGVPTKGIPYAENFDTYVEEWFQTGGTMQWQKGVPNASIINNAYSSPNVWATVLNGNYINGSNDYLYTPYFNNQIFKADTLMFWYWMDAENNLDGGRIEYLDYQDNWTVLGTIGNTDTNAYNWYNATSVALWTGNSNGWKQAKYKISNVANMGNTLQFRFVFSSNGSNNAYNGWAIDNFELTLKKIDNDAGVISINNSSTCQLGDTIYPTVTVVNNGILPLSNIPIKYSVNGQTPVSETINSTLAPGSSMTYQFNTYFKVLSQPTYILKVFTTVTGDYYTGSDTATKVVNVSPATKDVGIVSIESPGNTVSSGSTITVTIKIKNYGTTPLTSIPVAYQRGTQPVQNATWTGPALNLGDSAIFSFPTTFVVPLGASFTFSAYTNLSGDAYPANNKITKTIAITAIPANAGSISSGAQFGGDTICFPSGSTNPISVTYTVPTISNATSYVWNYSGNNVTYNDTTTTNSVSIEFANNATDGNLTVYGINSLGNGGVSAPFAIDVIQNCTVGIDEENSDNFWLSQNMPNPANDNTIIEFSIPQQANVIFEVVNMIGQSVYYSNENRSAGKHQINLNTNELSEGIYYYSITCKGKRLVKKMLINK